jgi:hypothetical protein
LHVQAISKKGYGQRGNTRLEISCKKFSGFESFCSLNLSGREANPKSTKKEAISPRFNTQANLVTQPYAFNTTRKTTILPQTA